MAKAVQKEAQKGRQAEITLPSGVTASLSGRRLVLKGAKGEAEKELSLPNVEVTINGSTVLISSQSDSKKEKKIIGSVQAHVNNMAKGVSEGHVYKLKVCFTHFPITVTVSGKKLQVKNFLGEKTPRELELPDNVKVTAQGADVTVESASKETAGQVAGSIEQLTKRANYDTRVFNDGVYITMKDGKDIK